ncbi:1-(5-phosphoribosyl)-5-[(5-phosphoribosylamino)methylideneamino]imidazole-4-carboxamide isomerase [Ruminococcus sp. YE282]|jgi:phosphoribosylformimino-5-aminoimidazole carboxamide ribotide isomerase|uniref:1-(5-phosphoribosyl)-5-[(5- phosphoribosylamino)methylideneamino]imidazole-4- carboxamide isomerase n=1 Tax=Ruminococcus sp. YE282 TaxID=3158780 RepID=UPI00088BF6C4|nr:1-(5-phosphoribosyl)-5-[(5-phosphoribosylamino)methylideneamino]imidazole-4-carboxamide isomerase [Ruminococcus bromii]MEE3498295.1 1-(5-phosphoribosyl)-5-[(5-phosphoribosylamino)methylideneamino]imidazole-4-carboxamide isomerase [Ruminococcus bromii]SCY59083.1 1-(5-phosphoribosyl)-5-[(5-phosphoribosylamino)methylideneamino] imidazole-4-carboxamide isomerase [Ruminococcus bromii]
MIILPAIDIKGGECVRLVKGDYSTAQKVIESPYLAAQRFADAGANWMHMVDLDGAKDAKLVNADLIADVAKSSGLSVEVGGGIRDMKAVEYYLSHGINRVILGSAAVKDQQFVIDAVNTFGDQIVIGIDAKDGMVRAEGWLDNSEINYIELAKRMEDVGVKTIVFTDIEQDGTLAGPNLKQLDSLIKSVSCNIIASGGVAVLKDIKNLIELNAYGAICGKSIYSGSLDLRQAIETTRNS